LVTHRGHLNLEVRPSSRVFSLLPLIKRSVTATDCFPISVHTIAAEVGVKDHSEQVEGCKTVWEVAFTVGLILFFRSP